MAVSQGRDNYPRMHAGFRWQVPEYFNIAQVLLRALGRKGRRDRAHRDPRPRREGGRRIPVVPGTADPRQRPSHMLVRLGVQRGDRVAIVMPQRFETAVAYMAIFQLGAVAMPLSMLFGPDALEYRLQDSEAGVAICDESSVANMLAVRDNCPALRTLIGVGEAAIHADLDYEVELARQRTGFTPVQTRADEGAVLIYTSGTTGPPKGALIPHRAMIGNLPGFVCSQNWFGFDGRTNIESRAVFWSPADWAWTGGLMDALLPTLYFGRSIVALQRPLQPGAGLHADAGTRRHAHFPVPDGAQGDDEGLSRA